MRSSHVTFVGGAGLAAVALVMGGAITGLVLAPEQAPVSLTAGASVAEAPVTYSTFNDAKSALYTTVLGEAQTVLLGRAGTVTSRTCEIGSQVSSGDVPVSVDSSPVPALHTEYPLWRDLTPGLKGADVTAVQNELIRLGYTPSTSGAMDGKTVAAIKAFFVDRGHVKPDGTLMRSAIIWLPSQAITVGRCLAASASTVEAGDVFIEARATILAMEPTTPATDLVPGPRTIRFADVAVPGQDDGRVTDATLLAAVAASPEFAVQLSMSEAPGPPQISLSSALATPLNTAAVPAGTLFRVSENTGCVSAAGVGHPVTIVSSLLGSTYVTFDDGASPTKLDLIAAADRTGEPGSCS